MRSTIELRRLSIGAGAVLLLATSPAMTQTRQLEEVVVTAQKREQSLQDVAIAVSAFSGADLEDAGVLTIENLTAMTPGLAISSYNPATPAPYIRGVGTNSSSVGDDASVGVFIDEVYAGRAGGFNALAATAEEAAVPFDPETASNYEAGMKADLFDRRLRRNAAAFFMDYEDLQNFFLDDGAVVTATADAEMMGFELEAWASLAEGLELSTSWGYLDTEYTSFPGTPDNEGNNLMRSPEHGYALALNYQRSLGDTLTGSLRVDFSYQDEMFFDADNSTVGGADSYQVWNARFGLAHGGGWELALWASNLGDEDYVVHAFDIAGGGFAVHGNPRMWGITAGYEI